MNYIYSIFIHINMDVSVIQNILRFRILYILSILLKMARISRFYINIYLTLIITLDGFPVSLS